jgi:GNAT superfamily N-acetyltransferase
VRWIHENPPRWDGAKARVLGSVPPGALKDLRHGTGDLLPGEWWRVEQDGEVVGYGWMDYTWGDAEILLAVDDPRRRRGVGTFILDQLEREAAQRGLHYLYNVVPQGHPDRDGIGRWLENRRFERAHDDRYMRRVLHPAKH